MTQRKVTTRSIPWSQMVKQADPVTDRQSPPVVYEFGGGRRRFVDSGPNKGPYGP